MNGCIYDVAVIGGGVMGLFTAMRLAQTGVRAIVLEKNKIGYEKAASSGLTRSFRCDYLDPLYAGMAREARDLWLKYQTDWDADIFYPCGLVNLASRMITPDLGQSYAWQAGQGVQAAGVFIYDFASRDNSAGVLCPARVRECLLKELQKSNVPIIEKFFFDSVRKGDGMYQLGKIKAAKIIIAAGMWSNDVLRKCEGFEDVDFKITLSSPNEVRYFKAPDTYAAPDLPVFACLDMGVYGHPIIPVYVPYVKISHYLPPEHENKDIGESRIDQFCRLFMPELLKYESMPVTDADQCQYDYSPDRDFILGPVDEDATLWVATGWNGTGFKFAPLVAEYLAGAQPIPERFLPRRLF